MITNARAAVGTPLPPLLLCAALGLLPAAAALRVSHPNPHAAREPRAKVFYLFLVEDHIAHEDIWERFFASGQPGRDYEVLVHCAQEDACRDLERRRAFPTKLVKTVESQYCTDLVSPMKQLLRWAVARSTGDHRDKYVFLSHNSLPAKPFAEAHRALTEGQEGTASFIYHDYCGAVKASQWFVLSFAHVMRLLHSTVDFPRANSSGFPMFPDEECKPGCLDEMLPFAAIFGTGQSYKLTDRDPLRATLHNRKYMWFDWEFKGENITFDRGTVRDAGDFESRQEDDPSPGGEPGRVNMGLQRRSGQEVALFRGISGPAAIQLFTADGLRELRQSQFVFVRKVSSGCGFDGNLSLAAAFETFIFGGQ